MPRMSKAEWAKWKPITRVDDLPRQHLVVMNRGVMHPIVEITDAVLVDAFGVQLNVNELPSTMGVSSLLWKQDESLYHVLIAVIESLKPKKES